jgi:hypothetical protein
LLGVVLGTVFGGAFARKRAGFSFGPEDPGFMDDGPGTPFTVFLPVLLDSWRATPSRDYRCISLNKQGIVNKALAFRGENHILMSYEVKSED